MTSLSPIETVWSCSGKGGALYYLLNPVGGGVGERSQDTKGESRSVSRPRVL